MIQPYLKGFNLFILSCLFSFAISAQTIVRPEPIFESNKLYKYQTFIDVYGHNVSGILFIKRLDSNHVKLVFANESGFQLLALEFRNRKIRIDYCIKKLRKKVVLRTLKEDFSMILFESLCNSLLVSNENDNQLICESSKKVTYLYKLNAEHVIEKIEKETKGKVKVSAIFATYKLGVPNDIDIEHSDIKLNYHLSLIP